MSRLVLEWPPVPEHMIDHAGLAVHKAREIDSVVLDYTVASLQAVDRLLGGSTTLATSPL